MESVSRGVLRAAIALGTVLALATCGGEESAEAQLAAVDRALQAQRDELREARALVERKEGELEARRLELQQARERQLAAEQALAEAETRVDVEATDALLFRALQGRLLEDPDLRSFALRVEVQRGNVTLRGRIPDEAIRGRALGLIEGFPGVVAVTDATELVPRSSD